MVKLVDALDSKPDNTSLEIKHINLDIIRELSNMIVPFSMPWWGN